MPAPCFARGARGLDAAREPRSAGNQGGSMATALQGPCCARLIATVGGVEPLPTFGGWLARDPWGGYDRLALHPLE